MAWSSDERGNHVTAGRAASLLDPCRPVHLVAEHHDLALDVTHPADNQRPGMQCATQTRLDADITIDFAAGGEHRLGQVEEDPVEEAVKGFIAQSLGELRRAAQIEKEDDPLLRSGLVIETGQ
jgi:hypothetical protein